MREGASGGATLAHETLLKMRSVLDELEGVRRIPKGLTHLAWEDKDGLLKTGYEGVKSSADAGYAFDRFGASKFRRGATNEIAKWSYRDQLQTKLIRQARRLPYEVPGFIAADRVMRPIFGTQNETDPSRPSKKWYDPSRGVDIAKEIGRASLFQLGGFMLPTAAAGAAKDSSINFFRTAEQRIGTLTKSQEFIWRRGVNLQGLLQSVGQDLSTVFDSSIKFAERSAGGMSSAVLAASSKDENPVAALYRQRHGNPAGSTQKPLMHGVKDLAGQIFNGNKKPLTVTNELLDLIPGYKGARQGVISGYKQYKNLGFAQEILDGDAVKGRGINLIKKDLRRVNGISANASDTPVDDIIRRSVDNLQIKRSSPLADVIGQYKKKTSARNFQELFYEREYKKQLASKLMQEHGLDEVSARKFTHSLTISEPVQKSYGKTRIVDVHPVERITIGDQKILKGDFFQEVVDRFNASKIAGGKSLGIDGSSLQKSISSTDEMFLNNKTLGYDRIAILKQKQSINNAFIHSSNSVLSPEKLSANNFQNVMGRTSEAIEGRRILTTKVANLLGLKGLTEQEINSALLTRGIDPSNGNQLKAYLVNNKAMYEGQHPGIAGFFGFQKLSLDKFLDNEKAIQGRVSGVLNNDRKVGNLLLGEKEGTGGALARNLGNAVLESQGNSISNVKGYYTVGNNIINVNPLRAGARKALNFIGTETKIPIININPLQMVGLKDFAAMSKAGEFQMTSGSALHPFISGEQANFYTWHRTGGFLGTKGSLYRHTDNGAELLRGKYRPLPTDSTGMFAGTAEMAARSTGRAASTATSRIGRLKEKFDVDPEQENSLFRFFGRLVNRQADVNNPAVISATLKADLDKPFSVGGAGKSRQLVLRQEGESFGLFDFGTDKQVASHAELMESFHRFANETLSYGSNSKVIEASLPANLLAKLANAKDFTGVRDLNKEFSQQLNALYRSAPRGPAGDSIREQYFNLRKAYSRLEKFESGADLSSQSRMFEKSSSIVSRQDEYSSEVLRYHTQHAAITGNNSEQVVAAQVAKINSLFTSGKISSAQRAEAQASLASTSFNLSAFETFNFENGISGGQLINPSERFKYARTIIQHGNNASILDPHIKGTVAQAGNSYLNPLSKVLPAFKRNFGIGKYVHGPKVSSMSGQYGKENFTYIPTFGTALKNNPKATLLSASGIKTNGSPEGFSLASVPVSHGFNRLNRYFGTVGSKINTDNSHGPLDLYLRGMIGKRILPAVAVGTTALAIDRTAGGYTNKKDDRGERVYSPMVLGGVARVAVTAQSALSGLTPGGMTYGQKKQQMLHGEVAIRKGRFWSLGNTPFKGGKIEYYRPSWYRRFQAGAMFTSDTYGSPLEKELFYNDYSPLKPLDPYRFEKKHYKDRPYPVTGQYFSGPFGIATPLLNATVGKILKPQKVMHKDEVDAGLAAYVPAGHGGAYMPQEDRGYRGVIGPVDPTVSYPAALPPNLDIKPLKFFSLRSGLGEAAKIIDSQSSNSNISNFNYNLAQSAGATNTAKGRVNATIGLQNQTNALAARRGVGSVGVGQPMVYGPPVGRGIAPAKIVTAGLPIRSGSAKFLAGETGYRLQETLGIYGFAGGQFRKSLGLGQYDFEPNKSVLQSADKAYGSTRAFWDLNLGGLGDVPLQSEGALGNIEASEIIRRFVPKERTNVNFINPIKNTMAQKHPYLPGNDNFIDFTTGDPFVKVKEGELRLPGVGYERFNRLYPDKSGEYGAVNQLDILADVAPYSKEFRALNSRINKIGLSEEEIVKVGKIRAQQNAIQLSKTNFSPYEKESGALNTLANPISSTVEKLRHTDNFINNKFMGERNATEDWERRNVYGSTFPEWQRPVESFIKPSFYKGTQRHPLLAAAVGAFGFKYFGKTKVAQIGFATAGGLLVGGFSAVQKAKSKFQPEGPGGPERYIPKERKKELALEEYADILTYVKNRSSASRAEQAGDVEAAKQFMLASKKTMYGVDLDSKSLDQIAVAIPKRKRNHFRAMIEAPPQERKKILSTAGRLERRIYEAAWGMPVERKPDLVDYFSKHELPGAGWEGWHPNTNMDHVKIKMGQSMGLELSQMGYFPQQVKEANLVNPSYPQFGRRIWKSSRY